LTFFVKKKSGFFGPDCIRPFNRETVESDLKAKKFKTKDLENAIHQALDPAILKAEEEAERREEEEAERREEEEAEEKRKKKAAAGRKRTAVTKKTSSPAATKKRAATSQKKTVDNNNSINNRAKRARSEDASDVDRQKRVSCYLTVRKHGKNVGHLLILLCLRLLAQVIID
jgi:hypothetical protein